MIILHVEPRVVKTWKQFVTQNPPYSVALDGYVRSGPRFTSQGPYANFDHHQDVNRLSTRSSCAQVYLAIQQGLFQTFLKEGVPTMNLFVNDADQDVCMAVWLLRHETIVRAGNERIERLMHAVDHLDTTAGGYPIPIDSAIMGHIAWIFAPYTEARFSGKLQQMQAPEMHAIIDAVGDRLTQYAQGAGSSMERDTQYEILGGGPGWLLVKENGPYARNKLFAEGMSAFVAVREKTNGKYSYSIGKKASWVPFPLQQMYQCLNAAEGIANDAAMAWAGSDIIGGSPYSGSSLSPEQVTHIVNECITQPAFIDVYSQRDLGEAAD